jgi:hypothetical protein
MSYVRPKPRSSALSFFQKAYESLANQPLPYQPFDFEENSVALTQEKLQDSKYVFVDENQVTEQYQESKQRCSVM